MGPKSPTLYFDIEFNDEALLIIVLDDYAVYAVVSEPETYSKFLYRFHCL